MTFGQPLFLLTLIVAPLAAILVALLFAWKREVQRRLGDPISVRALVSTTTNLRGQAIKGLLLVLAISTAAFAAGRPQWGQREETVRLVGVDVMIALDTSLSMAARDAKPSRLELAKSHIDALLQRLPGGRAGLVLFAGDSLMRFPLTTDLDAVRKILSETTTEGPGQPGTSIASAVQAAVEAFGPAKGLPRILLLVSDGEDQGSQVQQAIRRAKDANVRIFTLGVGEPWGEPIPVRDSLGAPAGLKQDRQGNVVYSRLDEGTLRSIAEGTGGRYLRATGELRAVDDLVGALNQLEQQEYAQERAPQRQERFQLFVLAALLALVIEMVIPEGKRAITRSLRRAPWLARALAVLALIPILAGCQDNLANRMEQANTLYYQGKPDAALESYRRLQVTHPDLPQINHNIGVALYSLGQYARAVPEIQKSVVTKDDDLKAKGFYNLGNAYYRDQRWNDAIEAYKRTLRLNPHDLDAKVNLELAMQQAAAEAQSRQGAQPPGGADPNQQNPNGQSNTPPAPGRGNPQAPPPPGQSQNGAGSTTGQGLGALPADDQSPAATRQQLQQALQEAGKQLSPEEVERILDALRQRERSLGSLWQLEDQGRTPSGDHDW